MQVQGGCQTGWDMILTSRSAPQSSANTKEQDWVRAHAAEGGGRLAHERQS
jgi:hypothetical protein